MTTTIQTRAATLSASAVFCAAVLYGAASLKIDVLPSIDFFGPDFTTTLERLPKEEPEPVVLKKPSLPPAIRAPIDIAAPLEEVLAPSPTEASETVFEPSAFSEPEPSASVRRISGPRWLERPDGRAFAQHYPIRAIERGKSADVLLECQVAASGRLTCIVLSETPANWGFANAALKISQEFRMAPQMTDGQPTEGGIVRVPIHFAAPQD